MDCIFCGIVAGRIPARLLARTDHSVSFLDAAPLARGHALVIPKGHHERLQDMPAAEASDLFLLAQRMLSRVDMITGATLVAIHNGRGAGQEVPHVHVHLVPREPGDSAGPIHGMFDAPKVGESETLEMFERLRD